VSALNDQACSSGEAPATPSEPRTDAKKEKTRRESTPIKVWVTTAEKAAIAEKATAHSMSISRYLRALGLALPIQCTVDQRAMLDLLKINADLGRLGGLIKLWLTTNESSQSANAQVMQIKLDRTLNEISALQKKMKERVEAL
jgi:hypothetical protein